MPILVTSDLDIIEDIFIKQFSSFTARRVGFSKNFDLFSHLMF